VEPRWFRRVTSFEGSARVPVLPTPIEMARPARLSLALAIMLALLATAGFGLASGSVAGTPLQGVSVQPARSSATVAWKITDVPAKVVVEYGVDGRYGVWSETSAVLEARSGQTVLTGLEPGTTYQFHVMAVSPVSRLEATGSFTTWPIAPSPRAAIAPLAASSASSTLFKSAPSTASPTNLTIDGAPLFPRLVWRQCPYAYADSIAAGINVFLGTSCTTPARQLSFLGGKAYSAVDITNHGRLGGAGLIGWHLPDEGDEAIGSAAGQPNVHEPDKVTFLTLTDHFAPYMAPPRAGRAIYPGWFSRADIIGFDTYPLEGRCSYDRIPWVYSLQKTLVNMAGSKPTFQWIEAGPMEKCFKIDPTPTTVRAETWLAIAAGARGIGYFPDVWEQTMRDSITAINRDIVALAPALLDTPGIGIVGPSSPIRVGVRRHNGAIYVIAVNMSTKPVTGRLAVPALGDRALRVFGENRTITSQLSQIVDSFSGLGVHIYVAPPGGW
jgi:Fibronectin type III domain